LIFVVDDRSISKVFHKYFKGQDISICSLLAHVRHTVRSSYHCTEEHKRDRLLCQKQAKDKLKRREGANKYMEVWGNFLQMKAKEHKKREVRWNRSNILEERKWQIEERQLL
jgi:hypothetical protein